MQCSIGCGEGVQTRSIHCSAEVQRCNEINRPKSEKPCRNEVPCGGNWFTGPWNHVRIIRFIHDCSRVYYIVAYACRDSLLSTSLRSILAVNFIHGSRCVLLFVRSPSPGYRTDSKSRLFAAIKLLAFVFIHFIIGSVHIGFSGRIDIHGLKYSARRYQRITTLMTKHPTCNHITGHMGNQSNYTIIRLNIAICHLTTAMPFKLN